LGSVRENRKQKRAHLKIHFEEVKAEVEHLLLNLNLDSELRIPSLPGVTNMFEAHFPQEATEMKKYKQQIDDSNSRSVQLSRKVNDVLGSSGIPVVSIQSKEIPCVYGENVRHALFARWERLERNMLTPIDFTNLKEDSSSGKYTLLYVDGWGSEAVACVSNKVDKDNYKSHLINLVRRLDIQLKLEAIKLVRAADQLLKDFVEFRNTQTKKLSDIETFWPAGGKFEPTRNCTRCKELRL
jgi:hypothetical protein